MRVYPKVGDKIKTIRDGLEIVGVVSKITPRGVYDEYYTDQNGYLGNGENAVTILEAAPDPISEGVVILASATLDKLPMGTVLEIADRKENLRYVLLFTRLDPWTLGHFVQQTGDPVDMGTVREYVGSEGWTVTIVYVPVWYPPLSA